MRSLNNQSAFPHYDGLQSHLCLHDKSDLQINIYIFFFFVFVAEKIPSKKFALEPAERHAITITTKIKEKWVYLRLKGGRRQKSPETLKETTRTHIWLLDNLVWSFQIGSKFVSPPSLVFSKNFMRMRSLTLRSHSWTFLL